MTHQDFVNTSLRLRYEAFSKFATQANQADNLPDVGKVIAANLKFVLDVFAFRLGITIGEETYVYELFRGKCTLDSLTTLSAFERDCLAEGLPRTLTCQDIQQTALLQGSVFDHPKITYLMVLPIYYASGEQQVVVSIANKSGEAYTEVDFRFARLIEELLSTKIAQLLLTRQLASKNLELMHANQQLSQLNEEVRLLNAQLENKVEERTVRLQEAHEELNTLLYRTSHDFRRPLTSMLGLAQLFEMSQTPQETATLVQHLRTTVSGLDSMLMKLQTLMLTELDETPGLVDFLEILSGIEDQFQEELTQNHIDYRFQVDQPVEYVSYVSLYQPILENLVENAIQYRRSREPFILLKVKNTSSALTIQIVDNGIGIPGYLQSTVFNMYTKASDRTSGNGLGLFVVKKLVLALEGTIKVTSVAGKGSTFTVTLPLKSALLPID